jgi:hypothetical protein
MAGRLDWGTRTAANSDRGMARCQKMDWLKEIRCADICSFSGDQLLKLLSTKSPVNPVCSGFLESSSLTLTIGCSTGTTLPSAVDV